MRSNWTTALEERTRCASPTAGPILELTATVQEHSRKTVADWQQADSTTGLAITDTGVTLTDNTTTLATFTGPGNGYLTDLDPSGTIAVAVVRWGTVDPGLQIDRVIARLHPQRNAGQAKTVAKWVMQMYTQVEDAILGELTLFTALHDPISVDATGTSEADVTFDLRNLGYPVRPMAMLPEPSSTQRAVTVIVIKALKADGTPADNVGWAIDTNQTSVISNGHKIESAVADPRPFGWLLSAGSGAPLLTLDRGSFTAATITFTINPFTFGATPSDDVEFTVEAEVPFGTSIKAEVRNDADTGWVEFKDGQLHSDVGVSKRTSYKLQVTLTPNANGTATPRLTKLGVREVRRYPLPREADFEGGIQSIDPVTLKARIAEITVSVLRSGERDYLDTITNILSGNDLDSLALRIYWGDPDRPRNEWMLWDAFIIGDWVASGPRVQIVARSPLAKLRGALPVPSGGIRSPITYTNQTLKAVYDDLIDNQLALPGRFRGPGVSSTAYTVTKKISDSDIKTELDAIAYLAGSAVVSSQGVVRAVDVYGDKSVARFFPREIQRVMGVSPGFSERRPELFLRYQWDEASGAYKAERKYINSTALTKLGVDHTDYDPWLPDDISKWIDNDTLADAVGDRAVRLLGTGLIQLQIETTLPFPELELGDMVAVETDDLIARDPLNGRRVRGWAWVLGVVVSTDVTARRFTIWVRSYSDIFVSASAITRQNYEDAFTGASFTTTDGTVAAYVYRNTALGLPDGLWRTALYNNDVWRLQKNLASAGDFSSLRDILEVTPSGTVKALIGFRSEGFTEFKDLDATPVADRRLRVIDGLLRATDTADAEGRYISRLSLEPITNAEIAAAAGIAVSKLAAGGANSVLWSDGATAQWTTSPTIGGVVTINPGATPADALMLDIAALTAAGQRDSHILRWVGRSYDTVAHQVDWRVWVDVTSNAGASNWLLQSRIDAAAFGTRLQISDAGILTLSGQLRAIDGTAASPAWSFGNDTNTGIFRPAADVLGFAVAGVERLRIEPSRITLTGGGYLISFNGPPGGGGEGIVYPDSGGSSRYSLFFPGGNIVALGNRAANGVVQIRANTATAGSGGEVTVAEFQDDRAILNVATVIGATDPQSYKLRVAGTSKIDNDLTVGSLGVFDSTDVPTEGQILIYKAGSINKWQAETLNAVWGDSDFKAQILTEGAAAYVFRDPGTTTHSLGAPDAPSTPKVYQSHATNTLEIENYTKDPTKFRYFEWEIQKSTDGGTTWGAAITVNTTSVKLVHARLDLSSTNVRYRYRVRAINRDAAQGHSAFSAYTAAIQPKADSSTHAFGGIIAGEIAVANLAAISADIGIITAGQLRNTGNTAGVNLGGAGGIPGSWTMGINFESGATVSGMTRYIDFAAGAGSAWLKAEKFELKTDGTAIFRGVAQDADTNPKLKIDFPNRLLTVTDEQASPQKRIEFGKFGAGASYGFRLWDQSGNQIMDTNIAVGGVDLSQLWVGGQPFGGRDTYILLRAGRTEGYASDNDYAALELFTDALQRGGIAVWGDAPTSTPPLSGFKGLELFSRGATLLMRDDTARVHLLDPAASVVSSSTYGGPRVELAGPLPAISFFETDQAANDRAWDMVINAKQWLFRTLNDDGSGAATWLKVLRGSGSAIDTIEFPNGKLHSLPKVVGLQTTEINTGANTAEITLHSTTIPGNAMGANGVVRVTVHFNVEGTNSTKALRFKFGGTVVWAHTWAASEQAIQGYWQVLIYNRNATNSQSYISILNVPGSSTTVESRQAIGATVADTTANQNIVITGQTTNANDEIRIQFVLVELFHRPTATYP
ncbi:MAG: hypothetical protein KatS3mg109_1986 [Pirellulaceae bacterium]|nr:MAG: hypothetical protein KatS3mg109_1986 [Pirellulaceae bacterium]